MSTRDRSPLTRSADSSRANSLTRSQAGTSGFNFEWTKELGGVKGLEGVLVRKERQSEDESEEEGTRENPLVQLENVELQDDEAALLIQERANPEEIDLPSETESEEAEMEAQELNENQRKFARQLRDVNETLDMFTVDDVFEEGIDNVAVELANIKTVFVQFRSDLRAFLDPLPDDVHGPLKEEWEGRLANLVSRFKKNERDIKAKVEGLRKALKENEELAAAGRLAADEVRSVAKEKAIVDAKAEIERGDILKNVNSLYEAIVKARKADTLPNHEVVRFLKESSTWNRKLDEINKREVELKKQTVTYPLDPGLLRELEDAIQDLRSNLKVCVQTLEKEDTSRQLYTNAASQAKDAIMYPTFKSKDGEDVHKFLREFKEALIRNRIPKVDQVKLLKQNLKGFAHDLIPNELVDVEEAYKMLNLQFGSSDAIWAARHNIFMNECDKKWPTLENDSKGRFQKIAKVLTQFGELEKLISEGSIERAELYNQTTVKQLYSLLPGEITTEALKKTKADTKSEGKINALKLALEQAKNIAQQKMLIGDVLKEPGGDKPERFNYQEKRKNICFYCDEDWKDETHIKEWGVFGCPKLLKMPLEIRVKEMKRKKLCLVCGFARVSKSCQDPTKHKCKKRFEPLQCQGEYNGGPCSYNGLTCNHRMVSKDVKSKVKEKLRLDIPGFNLVIIVEGGLSSTGKGLTNSATLEELPPDVIVLKNDAKKGTYEPFERRAAELQSGEIAKQMKNSELLDHFKQLEKLNGRDPSKILGIPKGDPLFIYCVIQGKKNKVRAFLDGGCSSWLAREGIPQNEFTSVKLRQGPIPIWVAGGSQIEANAEWSSVLPLQSGMGQAVRGLSINRVTGPCGDIDMGKIMDEIREEATKNPGPGSSAALNLKAPKKITGEIDMLIGIKYQNLFPEPVFCTKDGLTLFKTKFYTGGEELACVGGPSKALAQMIDQAGTTQIMSLFHCMVENPEGFAPRMEYFPTMNHEMEQICQKNVMDEDLRTLVEEILPQEFIEAENISIQDDKSEDVILEQSSLLNPAAEEFKPDMEIKIKKEEQVDVKEVKEEIINSIQVKEENINSLRCDTNRLLDIENVGLKMEYKCPECRDCLKCKRGEQYEKVSIKQEEEQQLIKESIWIDTNLKRAIAKLPFRVDPDVYLSNNKHMAIQMLNRVCQKYSADPVVVTSINKAFKKLFDNGHIDLVENLPPDIMEILDKAVVSHYIPWDVAFSGSISTPARPVFNASKNTPNGGTNLNDTLVKGIPTIVSLVHMMLNWMAGVEAISGDISQFYNAVLLYKPHLPYQRFVIRENLNPGGKVLEGVIKTLIYGVRSVSAQTEELINIVAESIMTEHPDVADFLLKLRYVDDLAKGVLNRMEGEKIITVVDEEFQKYQLKIKGWVRSNMDPPENVSADGKTVSFAGFTWETKTDLYNLNNTPLHFSKKVRGRLPNDVVFFDPSKGTMEDFVPRKLTRRMISSVMMRRWDPLGKLAPLMFRLKFDLRAIIKVNPGWDIATSPEVRVNWVRNFQMLEKTKSFWYCRSVVPLDAVDPRKMRMWVLYDAAESGGIIVGAWAGYERQGGGYSCAQLISKALLVDESYTTPKLELHSMSVAANLTTVLTTALKEWVEVVFLGGDSEISMNWVIYESNKLEAFTRNRVYNIRAKTTMEQIHWVKGSENVADIGTRPQTVDENTVHPNSEFSRGKPWMELSYEDALKTGIIKRVTDIQLNNENKKGFKEGLTLDQGYEKEVKGFAAKIIPTRAAKIIQCEQESMYIYPPLKYPFRRTIRTIAIVLMVVGKWKRAARRRVAAKKGEGYKDEKKEPRYKYFPMGEVKKEKNLKKYFQIEGLAIKPKEGVALSTINKEFYFALEEEDLSEALEYLYLKGTEEVRRMVDPKKIKQIAIEENGVLLFKGRVLDEQSIKCVGELTDIIDVKNLLGFNFRVPILYQNSPLAVSIAMHLHNNVIKHKGMESSYRLSLNYVHILQGRALFGEICDDCIFCKKLRKRYLEVEMGALHDSQLSISPVFYATLLDFWGPLRCFVPGYEKVTRAGTKEYKVYALVLVCLATGSVNIQITESLKTGDVMSGFNRFFAETVQIPKLMFPDKQSSLLKAIEEMEGDLRDLQYKLSEERGVVMKACLPQGHSSHGRVERVIRSLQESLAAADVKSHRLTCSQWMTVMKGIECSYNSLPLGTYYRRSAENVSLLKILTPNLLLGKLSSRAPVGLFEVPDDPSKLAQKTHDLFRTWFHLWNVLYVPQIINSQQKWFGNSAQIIAEDDIVLFKLRESEMSAVWVLGKIEQIKLGRDGHARECLILYKSVGSTDRMLTVERPVREVVKLFNIMDTNLLEEIQTARSLAEAALGEKIYFERNNSAVQIVMANEKSVEKVEFREISDDFRQAIDQINKDIFQCNSTDNTKNTLENISKLHYVYEAPTKSPNKAKEDEPDWEAAPVHDCPVIFI